ncbi:MAG: DUF4097 family beta strand repeat protein [Gemmatimonadaceae bacterium]|nr:DUF4097 family beta strand repeat protein [Gemmatimonadaceae bacterium]NUO93580.1 DUF4097 family beta strand repeat protein [Gemmatimonadaceae bacterium]NUP55729.1 DUF4097 family beta strand repeat protein [Gemmatimonadaceae bacterium]NUP71939.1 DUF4097 family beta strand repeat protein [Gemmatimonadaceae bacterium]NUR33209.1 DUF4097 family beta strand repeat protein [Gemmatimonadaceae bacterium]
MYRHIVLAAAVLVLAVPAPGSAQSTAEERERARIEREREQAEQARQRKLEQAERDREREQDRRDRDREREQERWERERERRERESAGSLDTTVAFDARGTVTVTCPQGAVIVTGSDRNEIKVRARTENGAIRFTSNGMRATLEPASGRGCNDGRFEITVPAGARVSARSWSGSVSVKGVRGDLETRTQSADVDLRDVGRIDVESLSGDVTIHGVTGESMIHTVSGDIELDTARGDVEIETVSGDIDLRDVVAKQIRTHTTSGDVEFSGQILPDGRYEYNTHSGEIRLALPADVGAQLNVATFNGAIESDFPITLQAGKDHDNKRLSFTLGQGTARISAETFSGDITLTSNGRRRR